MRATLEATWAGFNDREKKLVGLMMTVFAICGVGALVAAVLLFFVPKLAFADVEEALLEEQTAAVAGE